MADLEQTVAIIFEGVDRMGSGVDSATKRMNSIVGAAQGVVDPIANATAGLLKFEAALLGSGVAVTGLAIKLAGDFDAQFREISTLIDAPADDLDRFRESVLAYGAQSTNSIERVNGAVYNAISAGVDYTQSLDAVNTAEQLSVAGKADLGDALTTLVSSLNAYGLGMDQASTFSDQLFTTVKNGQTTIPELGGSLAQVTGLAATAGVSFGELLAGIATLTATGSGTSESITQIRAAISALINPASAARTLAEELGLEFSATALESEGLRAVLNNVAEATGGNTEQIAQLFGSVEALNGVLTLTGLGAESFAQNIDAMGNSAGATEEAYNKMAGTVEQGNQRISNAFTATLIAIGDPLLDEFGGIQQAIASIFSSIGVSVSNGQLQQFVGLIEGVMQSLEQGLKDVAANLPAALETEGVFDGFVNGFEVVRDAIGSLFDGADVTTVEGLASVIATLGSGVQLLGEFTAETITTIGPFLEKLTELAKWVTELDPKIAQFAGTIGGLSLVISPVLSALALFTSAIALLGGSSGAVVVATRALGGMVTMLGRFAGPAGATFLAIQGLAELKSTLEEFDDFKFNFSDELVEELEKTSGAQRVTTEAGLFSIQKLAEGYVALSDRFGWGDKAEADFTQLSDAAIDAAIKVAESASRIGGESTDDIKLISDAAIQAAVAVATASNEMRAGLERVEAPFFDQLDELPESLSRVREVFEKDGRGVIVSAEAVGKALRGIQDAYDSGEIDEAKYNELRNALLRLRDSSNDAAKGQEVLAGEALSSEDAILKARKAVLEQTLALEQLASNERIKNIEFSVDFQVAKMETEAKRVESILNATSATITSTEDPAASMFDTLGGGSLSGSDRFRARDAIDQQLKVQEQAAEQQGRLIDAQIESLTAKTKALQNGEGLIKIESDGLEPALEMFMWQVLEKIQLRANAESAEFLLGINSTAP
ncbi:phage tail tape measure protein [Halomonas sp. TD01]|uniref:phage tail tape measure protein n=1 Tax=Halomonas sp. TD01 TaxID=999141 RepID=UPI000214E5DD|nr:phage tail tape measure protein [Halomonas sp. TD01]EGP18533.1 phage tail tape measure protein, TP901 family, core region [Halomonas sp. TD01]